MHARMQDGRHFESKHGELLQVVTTALKRLAGKAANLQAQQAATEEAEATRKQADLLTANLHRCQPGASSVEVYLQMICWVATVAQ